MEKVGNSKSTIGYRYGSFSEIEVSNEKQWTAVEILARGIKLLTFIEKRWGLSFKGVEGKIKFLNLEFVLKKEKGASSLINVKQK